MAIHTVIAEQSWYNVPGGLKRKARHNRGRAHIFLHKEVAESGKQEKNPYFAGKDQKK
ncbi:MAG: hypothetical protein NC432_05610 [Roseburia sp.]|nr:hypothetical protein [Roseburia sp.]MCM1096599.1 hypothetical protein [Ruminococcus flavefaciens]